GRPPRAAQPLTGGVKILPHFDQPSHPPLKLTGQDKRYTLSSPKVVVLFRGGYWQDKPGKPANRERTTLNQAMQLITRSTCPTSLIQYGSDGVFASTWHGACDQGIGPRRGPGA